MRLQGPRTHTRHISVAFPDATRVPQCAHHPWVGPIRAWREIRIDPSSRPARSLQVDSGGEAGIKLLVEKGGCCCLLLALLQLQLRLLPATIKSEGERADRVAGRCLYSGT